MNDTSPATRQWLEIVNTWKTYWRHPPDEAEVTTFKAELRPSTLPAAHRAMNHAKRVLDDRPSVAWLVRETRKRVEPRTPTRPGCVRCRGEGWEDQAERGERPMLAPCGNCRPTQHRIWAEGLYDVDAPIDSPRKRTLAEQGT